MSAKKTTSKKSGSKKSTAKVEDLKPKKNPKGGAEKSTRGDSVTVTGSSFRVSSSNP